MNTLRYSDIIQAWKPTEKPSYSTASSFTDTPMQRDMLSDLITCRMVGIGAKVWDVFTRKSGRRLTGQFHQATTFITKIATLSITIRQTFSASRTLNTRRFMVPTFRVLAKPHTLKRFVLLRLNGIDQRKDERGTVSTGSNRGPGENRSCGRALVVVPRLHRSPTVTLTFIARTSASVMHAATPALMTSAGFARIVDRHSALTSTARPPHAQSDAAHNWQTQNGQLIGAAKHLTPVWGMM